MDEFLADLYGTNEPQEADFEKVAHLDFLEKVAEEEGIDLDELSDEDLEELADIAAEALEEEGYYDGEEDSEEYEEYDEEDFEKEAEAKVEEADFLGRVMAHSFNQEMDLIEKDAGARMEAVKGGLRRGYGAARAGATEAVGRGRRAGRQAMRQGRKAWQKSPGGRLTEPATVGGRMKATARGMGRKADVLARRLGRRLGAKGQAAGAAAGAREGARAGWKAPRPGKTRGRRALDFLTGGRRRRAAMGAARGGAAGRRAALKSQRMRGYGALGAGAAGLGAAGAGAAYMGREKKSADEEWDEVIQARAWEHLMQAGLADEEGNFIPADQLDKTAGEEDLDYEVDAAALELLEAEGYPVEWY